MSEIKYVVRHFSPTDEYLYSIHCSADVLDEVLAIAKSHDYKFKVVAYKSDSESEV